MMNQPEKKEWWQLPGDLEKLFSEDNLEQRAYTPSEIQRYMKDLSYNYSASRIRRIALERTKRDHYTFVFYKCPGNILGCPCREEITTQQCNSTRMISPRPGCIVLNIGWIPKNKWPLKK